MAGDTGDKENKSSAAAAHKLFNTSKMDHKSNMVYITIDTSRKTTNLIVSTLQS
uniref:Uncharacterized protein n=1 Tax=Arion vulgaris TaxID=1028688 RepID=A0A0B7ACN1_9EUPU